MMNSNKPFKNADRIDVHIVSASLCYLLTRFQQEPSNEILISITGHLRLLVSHPDLLSTSAHVTYQKLLASFQEDQGESGKAGPGSKIIERTIH